MPQVIDTPHGPCTVDEKWYLSANGDMAQQFVADGIIYKHIKRFPGSEQKDQIWHQHGQLSDVPDHLWFYADVSNGDRPDAYVRELGVLTILARYKDWAKEYEDERTAHQGW